MVAYATMLKSSQKLEAINCYIFVLKFEKNEIRYTSNWCAPRRC